MKVAVKVGPQDWKPVLEKSETEVCEIWFRLDWKEKYTPLFKYLKKKKIDFGLHFWATVDNKYFPNLLNLNQDIAEKTFELIKQTIDIASHWQAKYVNFHPESYRLSLLDLDKMTLKTLNLDKPFDRKKSFKQLLFYLKKIKKYAKEKKVTPLIETVPKYFPSSIKNLQKGRLTPQKSEGLETEKFFKLVEMGYLICFDIEHTMSQLITNNRKKLFNYALKAAKKMKPSINLIHVTTKLPPFNGTDSHNGVLEEDFQQKVIPNKKQLIQILSLFKDKDIWLIPEPYGKMIENHFALKEIIRKVEKKQKS